MKDHEIAATINEVRDIAVEYRDAQQLRERLAQVLRTALVSRPAEARDGYVFALATLRNVSTKLRRAGACLPVENRGTIESAMHTGMSIALAVVESEIEALGVSLGASTDDARMPGGSAP